MRCFLGIQQRRNMRSAGEFPSTNLYEATNIVCNYFFSKVSFG